MTLRWRKEPRPTGLSAVGAGPRASNLYLNDEKEDYLASVYPSGGNWRKPLEGWYWVVPARNELGLEYVNTCYDLVATEKEAKDAAKAYVVGTLKRLSKEI